MKGSKRSLDNTIHPINFYLLHLAWNFFHLRGRIQGDSLDTTIFHGVECRQTCRIRLSITERHINRTIEYSPREYNRRATNHRIAFIRSYIHIVLFAHQQSYRNNLTNPSLPFWEGQRAKPLIAKRRYTLLFSCLHLLEILLLYTVYIDCIGRLTRIKLSWHGELSALAIP